MRTILAVICAASLLAACGKDVKKKPKNSEQAASTTQAKVPDPEPTVDEALAAVVRAHPNSLKVCKDDYGYFVSYGPPLKAGQEADNSRYYGWQLVQGIKFYQSTNKTWFVVENKEVNYFQVYPDVTGLKCKDTPPL